MAITAWAAKFWTNAIMPFAEGSYLLAEDRDDADQSVLVQHRYAQDAAVASKRNGGDHKRIALQIVWLRGHVGDLDRLFGVCRTPNGSVATWSDDSRPRLFICRWRVVMSGGAKAIPVLEIKRTKLGVADADCVLQHGCKHWLKIAGRA